MRHISLFLCKSAELIPCIFSSFSLFFSPVLSQQPEHIATRPHCPWFSMERTHSYELSNRCLRQSFLRQKINSSQIKVWRFQWTPSLSYFLKYEKCVFKTSGRLHFSLSIINQYYNLKMFLLRIL